MLRRTSFFLCFVNDLRALKTRFRGRAQYSDAQAEAVKVYHQYLPTGPELATWLDEERATAALNGLQFFEVSLPQQRQISEFARQNLLKFSSTRNKLLCAIALCNLEGGVTDHKSFVQMDVVPPLLRSLTTIEARDLQNFTKLLQRCGCSDEGMWTTLADEVMRRLGELDQLGPGEQEGSYSRIFSGTSRFCATHPVNDKLLQWLLRRLPRMKSFDFSSLVGSVQRLHHKVPQDPSVLEHLLRRASTGGHQFTGRDLSTILKALVKIQADMFPALDAERRRRIELSFHAAAMALEPHISRFLDSQHPKYWHFPSDVVTVFFSLETSESLPPGQLPQQFAEYVDQHTGKLSAGETAIAAGVLRRTGLLQGSTLAALASRAAALVDEFHVEELAHVAATFACRKEAPQYAAWLERAQERVAELVNERTSPTALLYLAVAFPHHPLLGAARVHFPDVAPRHLIDCLTLARRGSPLWRIIGQEINRKFEEDAPFSARDLRRVTTIDTDGALHVQGQAFVLRRLAEDTWRHDTLSLLPVVKDANVRTSYLSKSVEQAEQMFLVPQASLRQLEQAASLIVEIFGAGDLRVRNFVRAASDRLVQGRSLHPLMQFLGLAIRHPELVPDDEWIDFFIFNPVSRLVRNMNCANLTRVLELLEARGVPVAEKFREPIEVIVECGTEAAHGDDLQRAVLIATAVRLRSGAAIPAEAIARALRSNAVPADVKATLRSAQGDGPAAIPVRAAPGIGAASELVAGASRFHRRGVTSVAAEAGGVTGVGTPVSPGTSAGDPLLSLLDDEHLQEGSMTASGPVPASPSQSVPPAADNAPGSRSVSAKTVRKGKAVATKSSAAGKKGAKATKRAAGRVKAKPRTEKKATGRSKKTGGSGKVASAASKKKHHPTKGKKSKK